MSALSKHFITDPTHLVSTSLHSLTLTNPSLALDPKQKIIYRRAAPRGGQDPYHGQVSIISGGGSGHEPSFAGFVGDGLLAASVAGSVFASPSTEQVRYAIETRVPKGKGVCVVVMNYTGDILNFGLAVEKARGAGVDVEMVVVGDDVGVGRERSGKVGRRGIAGTCMVLKIAGGLAATGAPLEDVVAVARQAAENIVSVGASLSHVHVPGRGETTEDGLKDGEVEVGMGIHNEQGSERASLGLVALVKKMLAQLLDSSDKDRNYLSISKSDKIVLLVNNLGGVSPLELGGITTEVYAQLSSEYGIELVRIISGTFMTSLNGLGFSISLLKLVDTNTGYNLLDLLDAPSEAAGWSAVTSKNSWGLAKQQQEAPEEVVTEPKSQPSNIQVQYAKGRTALTSGLNRVIKAEPDITKYDTVVGDGDCGIGLKRGAEALLEMLKTSEPTDDLVVLLDRIIQVVESTMDGTSGALYAIFLNALVKGIREQSTSEPQQIQAGIWARALEKSLVALSKYTPAQVGDRTLIDALNPFISTLSHTGSPKKAAAAASEGAQKTKTLKASLGRSVYIGGDDWQSVPDPGAYGLSEFLSGFADGLG